MPRNYIGGLKGVTPLAGDPVDLRTSGVFNLGSLGGDVAGVGGDADFDSAVLLLDGDGTNGQTTFTDKSNASPTIAVNGNTQVRGVIKKYGTGSIEFDGNGDYLRTNDFGLTSGDFTIEAWVRLKAMPTSDSWPAAYNSWMEIVGVGTTGSADGWQFRIGQTQLAFGVNGDNTAVTGPHGMSTGTWYHLAVTRSGNVYAVYVNGFMVGSATYTAQQPGSGAYGWVGSETGQGAYLNGYIDDLRITKGGAIYSSTGFTPPTSALTNTVLSGTVVLRLNGDGTNGQATFTDQSSSPITVSNNSNNVQVDTGTKKFGSGSIKFDSTTDWLYFSDLSLGTDNFTIETWLNVDLTTSPRYAQIIGNESAGIAGWTWMINGNGASTGDMRLYCGGSLVLSTASGVLTTNTWHHIALTKVGDNLQFFVDGISVATDIAHGFNFSNASASTAIGRNLLFTPRNLVGYMDDFRITKGAALYPYFTPPTSALTNTVSSGTVDFRLNGDGNQGDTTFTDLSSSPYTITQFGDAEVQLYSKYGTGSIKFDGTGDYLEVDFQDKIGVSRDPFTVECWVYFDTLNDEGVINLTQGGFGQGGNSLAIGYYSNQWRFYDDNTGTATGVTPGPSTGQWYHTAIVFNGTDLVFYIDGQARLTRSNHFSNMPAGGYPTVIFGGYFGAGYELDGKIDDIRVTKGVARYSSSFTPPTSALPTTGTVAGAKRPTRKWGGLVGRSLITSDALVKTGNLKLSELLQATYPAPAAFTWDGTGAEILLVGGGGAGGGRIGGGGGAGAMIELTNQTLTPGQSYSLTVGAGGLGKVNTAQPDDGGDTTGFTYTATGGGYGGVYQFYSGNSGGSGGGGSGLNIASNPYTGGGTADNSSYGNNGGNGAGTSTSQKYCGGGGGGRSGAGSNGNSLTGVGGIGGAAKQWAVDSQYHAGGGQGCPFQTTTNPATSGGAGAGNDNGTNATTRDATSHGTNGGYGNGGGGYRNVGDNTTSVDRGGNGYQGVIKVWVPIASYVDYVAGTPANVSSSALTYNSTVGTLLTVTGNTTLTFN